MDNSLDKDEGGKVLLLPPGYSGTVPDGYLNAQATTYNAVLGVRGCLVGGKGE